MMAAETAVRRAVRRDLDALLSLSERYCAADGHEFHPERARNGFAPLLESDRLGIVWVAQTDAGTLTGYGVVTWGWSIESGGLDALLDELYAERRHQGIGAALLATIVADCMHRGCSRLFLETERANRAARRFYTRHGFAAEDSIWMSLDLTPPTES